MWRKRWSKGKGRLGHTRGTNERRRSSFKDDAKAHRLLKQWSETWGAKIRPLSANMHFGTEETGKKRVQN